ncbi:MAG: hypothetical protein ACLP0A_07770 [Verrucomicrobiia bacterium]
MKKLSIVVAALVIAGTVSSWAQTIVINTTSNEIAGFVVGPLPISFTGKLSNKGSVDAATLAAVTPSGGTLEFAAGYDVAAFSTGQVTMAIGTSFATTNEAAGGGRTNVTIVGYSVLEARDFVDLSTGKSKSLKFESGWKESDGFGSAAGSTDIDYHVALEGVVSNATLLISGSITDPKSSGGKSTTNVSAKVSGVWQDGVSTITGSVGKPSGKTR